MNIPEFGVAEFSNSIKKIVEDSFGYVRIRGEIIGFKEHRSQHLYFSLKEGNAIISAICFQSNASNIDFRIENGLEVVISGKVTTYSARSNYQIIAEKIEIAGIGTLLKKIEKLKIDLQKEGVFDIDKKLKIPKYPKNIAIITSKTGAVIEDMKHRISQRYPLNIKLYHVNVQGVNSVKNIIDGINYFAYNNTIDLIVIARGGGSFEDLLPYNDELLVRAVYNSKIPIVSAIGHETDNVLIDYAADLRAPTPSAAAELITPNISDLKISIDHYYDKIGQSYNNYVNYKISELQNINSNIHHPLELISTISNYLANIFKELNSCAEKLMLKNYADLNLVKLNKQLIDNNIFSQRLILKKNIINFTDKIKINFQIKQDKLNLNNKIINALSYKNTIKRGFAVIKKDNKILTTIKQVSDEKNVTIELIDGQIEVKI
jgi:exodeoxyribonuclease VII large subunit